MKIDEIRAHVERWQAADLAIAKGKSYTIDGLTYTRQDAEAVRAQLDYWTRRLAFALRAGGGIRRQTARVVEYGGKLC